MANPGSSSKKVLGVFSLAMINVIAVDSLRSLPATAHFGFAVVFYYIAAGLLFFIPSSLIAAELATTWPKTGGIYVWAKNAFSKETAFLLVSLQWIYNVCWYPTILSLMAAILAYCIKPELAHSTAYMFLTISAMFWGILGINCLGLKYSSYLTSFSAVVGTLIPIGLVIILGSIWFLTGHQSQISFSLKSFLPDLNHIGTLAFFTSVLFSLMGMEMSAVHAQEVKNPRSDYPKALLISALLILASFILASLAIAVVVPVQKLSVVSGLLEAYQLFFNSFHMKWMMPVLAVLMICGGAGGVSAWLLGPVKALLVASQDGLIPKSLAKLNRFNAPYRLILLQGVVFMVLTSAFLFMPTVSAGFWLLSDLASQISLIFYCGLFIVAIRLRYSHPEAHRPFQVPFGQHGMWLCGISGIACCLFTILAGFLPPPGISLGSLVRFESFLIIGLIFACSFPLLISKAFYRSE
ncbi:MAG: Amino acid transporter [Gammaproteobacteria bacterium]|jgi:amino acid transporter|nr:Amino acid transporter [Gammaproteobacteria bacterium]